VQLVLSHLLPSFAAAAARRALGKDSTMVQKKKKAAAPAKLRKPPKRDAVAILEWPKISLLDPPREQEGFDFPFFFSLSFVLDSFAGKEARQEG